MEARVCRKISKAKWNKATDQKNAKRWLAMRKLKLLIHWYPSLCSPVCVVCRDSFESFVPRYVAGGIPKVLYYPVFRSLASSLKTSLMTAMFGIGCWGKTLATTSIFRTSLKACKVAECTFYLQNIVGSQGFWCRCAESSEGRENRNSHDCSRTQAPRAAAFSRSAQWVGLYACLHK